MVPIPHGVNIIGIKWIFKKKSDEHGNININKAHLVTQRYTQVEGINFVETFTPVARLESIRLLMVFACTLRFSSRSNPLHKMKQ